MSRRFPVPTVASALAAAALAALVGCGDTAPAPAPDVYTVRGVIEKLPAAEGPDRSLYVHHQAIPGYRDAQGKVVGMMSMTMPFPVASGVSLEGLAPGDAVEFTFSVTWKPRPGYRITALSKLPAGTTVDFTPTP